MTDDFYSPSEAGPRVAPPVLKSCIDEQTLKTWAQFPLASAIPSLERLNIHSTDAPSAFDPMVGQDAPGRGVTLVKVCTEIFQSSKRVIQECERHPHDEMHAGQLGFAQKVTASIVQAAQSFRSDKVSRTTPEVAARPEMRPVVRDAALVVRSINDVDAMNYAPLPVPQG